MSHNKTQSLKFKSAIKEEETQLIRNQTRVHFGLKPLTRKKHKKETIQKEHKSQESNSD